LWVVSRLLARLGRAALRLHWIVIHRVPIILGGLLGARIAFGGQYVNNYPVPYSESNAGLDVLNSAWWLPRWLEPVVPRRHLEESQTSEVVKVLPGLARSRRARRIVSMAIAAGASAAVLRASARLRRLLRSGRRLPDRVAAGRSGCG
jgi:hypothetical protein